MVRIARFAVAAITLGIASPALASDFSGIGRAIEWLFCVVVLLIAIPIILWRTRKHGMVPGANAALALVTSVLLAPGVYMSDFAGSGPLFTPLPGTLIAAVEGSFGVLFPVPLISIGVCTLALFLLLQRRGDGIEKTDIEVE